MTPPAAAPAAPARRHTQRRPLRASPPPRRVSGPRPGTATAGAVVLPLPGRAAGAALRGDGFPLLDRLVRGRLWIGLIAVALMGIVFAQVSLLELNAGISRSVATAEALERSNSRLRAEIATLGAPERVQAAAAGLQMQEAVAGGVQFLQADEGAAGRAAQRLAAPDPAAWQAALAAEAAQAAPPGTDVEAQVEEVVPTAPAAVAGAVVAEAVPAAAPEATPAQPAAPAQPPAPVATAAAVPAPTPTPQG